MEKQKEINIEKELPNEERCPVCGNINHQCGECVDEGPYWEYQKIK